MAVRFYDEALKNKIQDWIKDPNIKVLSPNDTTRLFQIKADETNDKPITLPLISLSRDSEVRIRNANKRVMSFDGVRVRAIDNETKEEINPGRAYKLNAIPVAITYQLDIYARYYEEADEYARNFLFNLINYPKLTIEIPYNNVSLTHDSNINLNSSIEDNSEVPLKLFSDQFYRWTFTLTIEDAYIFSVPLKENILIDEEEIICK